LACSVDSETGEIVQEVIEKEFVEQTIIAVIHRLTYVNGLDRVVFMNHGEFVECDSPLALLRRDSEFRKQYMALQRAN
jgi:ABC-type multidrug transport system fused ATPase/permease subunit